MTVLQALDSYYGRMAARGDAEAPGYGREKISFCLLLAHDGAVLQVLDTRDPSGRRMVPRLISVPKLSAASGRTVAIAPNLFWDKTAYVLGRTGGEGRRTAAEHAAFRTLHLKLLDGQDDPGLAALRAFLSGWMPERFDSAPFTPDMLDTNIVFRLDGDRDYLHDRPAARAIASAQTAAPGKARPCLVTGEMLPPARLHPQIRGVENAQSSGASLVSFNLDAFTSYGQEQGNNAPTSEAAAFRYGEALNRMLDRGSRNRIARPIGDTTIVFWADTSETVAESAAVAAETDFASWIDPPAESDPQDDAADTALVRDRLDMVSEGRPDTGSPALAPGTQFHVLGLAPNAARLAIRLWLTDDFSAFAERLGQHKQDLRIEPPPWRTRWPSVQRLLVKTTALQEKFDNIPPLLAGEVMRAILSGGRYPRSWMAAAILRLRAGDDPATGWHAAAIRAVLARDHRLGLTKELPPMSLNRDNPDTAYQLGRFFAALEVAQRLALPGLNATIRDRYFGAASATPAGVFPLLVRGAQNHLGKLRKEHKGAWLEREIEEINDHIGDTYPATLRLEAQGRFFLGYYHQRRAQSAGRPQAATDHLDEQETPTDEQP